MPYSFLLTLTSLIWSICYLIDGTEYSLKFGLVVIIMGFCAQKIRVSCFILILERVIATIGLEKYSVFCNSNSRRFCILTFFSYLFTAMYMTPLILSEWIVEMQKTILEPLILIRFFDIFDRFRFHSIFLWNRNRRSGTGLVQYFAARSKKLRLRPMFHGLIRAFFQQSFYWTESFFGPEHFMDRAVKVEYQSGIASYKPGNVISSNRNGYQSREAITFLFRDSDSENANV